MSIRERNYKLFTEWLVEEYSGHHVDYENYVDEDKFDQDYTADDLYNAIDEVNGFEEDIIYFSTAMNYLMEEDNSLRESLNIAEEYGYSPGDLNSEILASLLASRRNREEFPEIDIDDFLSQLDWDDDDEEE